MFVPKTAMVLAAGYGKRMRPLSATTPKPLIEIAGRALIDHCLDGLSAAGIGTAIVNLHYLAELIEIHLSNREQPEIIISDEREQLLDTGGGIVKALPLLGDTPFVLRNSDSFWLEGVRPNLRWLFESWDEDEMDGLLLLASTVRSAGYSGRGYFLVGPDGKLSRRRERTLTPFVFARAAVLHPRLF